MSHQHNQTKIYRFTQQLLNYQENYFETEGTLTDIMYRWFHSPAYVEVGKILLDVNKDTYTNERKKIIEALEKQKVFIEIVDESCYSQGWVTKIEEI